MTFDLFTLAAQIVNFVILLVLLRVFLYRPVRRVMHERERRIAQTRAQAAEEREEARHTKERLEAERESWERERRERERALEREIDERRERRLEAVEEEIDGARNALADALERDRDDALTRLRRRSQDLLEEELRRALFDLADASLERQAVAAFRSRLDALPEEQRTELRAAATDGPVTITTASELHEEARGELVAALHTLLGDDVEVAVERDEDLGFGVALHLAGMRVAWSADAYVDAFAEAQADVLSRTAEGLRGTSERGAEAVVDER